MPDVRNSALGAHTCSHIAGGSGQVQFAIWHVYAMRHVHSAQQARAFAHAPYLRGMVLYMYIYTHRRLVTLKLDAQERHHILGYGWM